jgi:N6-adenosine-specific RNA methylase IME4/ParB-like chromosome segregation protein Spo0J
MPDASGSPLQLVAAGPRGLALAAIIVPTQRARRLRPGVVATLAESLAQAGLLNPITVIAAGKRFRLCAGHHRLEAARQLGWKTIDARILPRGSSALVAELAEIDENLIRAELSPAERAAHHARRKTIYEALHPETKRGGDRKSDAFKGARSKAQAAPSKAYTRGAAAKLGKSNATVKREVARGAAIADIASLAGTSLDKGEELDALAKLGDVARISIMKRAVAGQKVSAKTEWKKEQRAATEMRLATATLAASRKLGTALYGVIYADPPWRFAPYAESGMDRAADNHYPTLDLASLKALPIPAAADGVLFLWATVPMLEEALELSRAWGFTYRSHYVWVKDKDGTGYWNRNRHELLLVAVKGNVPAPAMGTQPCSVIAAPRGKHSAKPNEVFAGIIRQMFPNVPRVELFARARRDGWASWGNEIESETTTQEVESELDGIDVHDDSVTPGDHG